MMSSVQSLDNFSVPHTQVYYISHQAIFIYLAYALKNVHKINSLWQLGALPDHVMSSPHVLVEVPP